MPWIGQPCLDTWRRGLLLKMNSIPPSIKYWLLGLSWIYRDCGCCSIESLPHLSCYLVPALPSQPTPDSALKIVPMGGKGGSWRWEHSGDKHYNYVGESHWCWCCWAPKCWHRLKCCHWYCYVPFCKGDLLPLTLGWLSYMLHLIRYIWIHKLK